MEKHSIFKKRSAMVLMALFCCFLWGSAFPSMKLSYAELGMENEFQEILFAGIRFFLAGLIVLVFGKAKLKIKITPKRTEIPLMLLIAFLQTVGAYVPYYIGLGNTTGVKGSVIASMSVFIVAIFAHFMFKSDRLNWKKGVGLICGFAGVVMVNLTLIAKTSFTFTITGEGFIVLHALFCALTIVIIRKYADTIDIVKLNGWQLFIGGLMLIAVGFAGSPQMLSFNFISGALLVYMAALSATAFTLWFILLKYYNATTVEQFKFAIPLFGTLLSVILVPGESMGPEMLIAAILVAAGIIIINRQDKANTI
ncbi:MAG: DMT family transporter [Christensenellales bacterium]|jgi:drug/metabolite transporter (DMT)-like permease